MWTLALEYTYGESIEASKNVREASSNLSRRERKIPGPRVTASNWVYWTSGGLLIVFEWHMTSGFCSEQTYSSLSCVACKVVGMVTGWGRF